MIKKISRHLEKLATKSAAVKKEFFPTAAENKFSHRAFIDPLLEDNFTPTKGLCHKYPSRVLVELTMDCAAYCRFCTRRRKVSDIKRGKLEKKDVDNMLRYLKTKPQVNEVVISGGDPLLDQELLIYALGVFYKMPQIKVIRVHTRVPVAHPQLITPKLLKAFSAIKDKPLFLSVHFEHPDELAPETVAAIKKIRQTGAILLSQSVFLKGINDSYETLKELFSRLVELGIRPYYIYHCDLVKGVEHFIVPIKKEITIMTKLRKNLSGIAFPFHVVDTPNGSGKIPVPLGFWHADTSGFTDFKNKKIKMY